MRLIGVVGLPGSGKGEFSRCAAELGIPVLVMGDVVRRVAAERGLAADDAVLGRISGELRGAVRPGRDRAPDAPGDPRGSPRRSC